MRRIIPTLLLLSSAACAVNTDDPTNKPSPFEHVDESHDVYGRTSAPTACASGEDAALGKCYAQCKTGYAPMADAAWCGATCPSGYTDEGDSCFRAPQTVAANMNGCFSSMTCTENLFMDCMVCPSGFKPIDDCKCWMGPDTITKATYDRSDSAKPFDTCAAGEEQDGALCYAPCKAGFHAVSAMCLPD